MKVELKSEEFPVVGDVPLRLAFDPDAIREHFEYVTDTRLENVTEEQLLEIGHQAVLDDGVYDAYHEALRAAILKVAGVQMPD